MRLPDADPGSVARGWLEAADLPTGDPERLPVVVVEGGQPGPTAWVTGGVHGNEVTGIAAAQDVAEAFVGEPPVDEHHERRNATRVGVADPAAVRGRIVCVPVVNPAGLRRASRGSYYHDEDPNRAFPDPTEDAAVGSTVQERVAERLYDAFADADLLVDLHTAGAHSVPFVIRHRVLHGDLRTEREALELSATLDRLEDALGIPVVGHYPPSEYVERGLHRSMVGAAVNGAGVPAVTVELGGHGTVDPTARAAGVAEVFRALVAFDMLESVPGPVDRDAPSFEVPVDFRTRRYRGPRTSTAGIVRHRVAAGGVVEEGEVIADVRAPTGELLESVGADHDGYVLGHRIGAAVYENDAVASMAVRDDEPPVAERP